MYKHLGFDNMQNPDLPPELMGEKTMDSGLRKVASLHAVWKMGDGLDRVRLV